MDTLTVIQILFFTWYPVVVYRRFGLLSSISASSYRWAGPKAYFYFTGWLAGLGILSLLQASVDHSMIVYFGLMAMGFAWAGVTVHHKSNDQSGEDEWHTAGTILAMAAGFIGLMASHGVWIPAAAFVAVAVGLRLFARNWIWWVECAGAAGISIGLLMR